MNAVTVCVEYDDLLALVLPRNARHFDRVLVVTSIGDHRTVAVAMDTPNVDCFQTDLFFQDGARFNKGRALEAGFDVLGRQGWTCIFDADIVMPPKMELPGLREDCLYSPHRRMCPDPATWDGTDDWRSYPRFPDRELAGYFHLFHASAPGLQTRPWYGIDWEHAGGCDSDFSAKWLDDKQIRLPFDVLHLGGHCNNWYGRCSPRLDGSIPEKAAARQAAVEQMHRQRKIYGYTHEHIYPRTRRND